MRSELLGAGARFLLLIGDQVYADALPPVSVRVGLRGATDDPPPLEAAVAAYRRVTRGFFGEAGFRALRQALPTYCAWDDHDIFQDWGSRREESLLDQRLFAAACQVYGEYQHARNPGGGVGPPPYDYSFPFGTAVFLVLDVRGARDFTVGRLLGSAQWERLLTFLSGPVATAADTLFVVATVLLAHAARWFA